MNAVAVAAVVSMAMVCLVLAGLVCVVVSRVLPPRTPTGSQAAPRPERPAESRTEPRDYGNITRHPSQQPWPTQGDVDGRT